MHKTNYCGSNKSSRFRELINIAKVTKPSDYPSLFQSNRAGKNALESLLTSIDSEILPIIPLLYKNICHPDIKEHIRHDVKAMLHTYTLRLLAADMVSSRWLTDLLDGFHQAHLPVLLLKGFAFSGTLYPEETPRLSGDIDLLVTDETDFQRACEILGVTMCPVVLDSKRIHTYDTLFERVFQPKNQQTPIVEVHKGLTNPYIFTIDNEWLWHNSRPHPAYNSDLVRILSPEDTLLHLAVHAFRDLDFCTHNLLDAHEVWCQWRPDPEKLIYQAGRWGARKVLFYLLANCRMILGTPIPHSLLHTLSPSPLVNGINGAILRARLTHDTNRTLLHRLLQLFSQVSFPDHVSGGIKYQLWYMKVRIRDWHSSHDNHR